MSRNILIVTPLLEEYNDLYHSLSALGLESNKDKIGKLDVHRFSELNATLARGGHGKPSLVFRLSIYWITPSLTWSFVPVRPAPWPRK